MTTELVTIDGSKSNSSDAATALADDFFNRFNVSKLVENDPKRPHPKFSTYCRKFCPSSAAEDGVKRLQEKRRQELLDNLKRNRQKILDNLRPIMDFIEDTDDCDNETAFFETATVTKKNTIKDVDIKMEAEEATAVEAKVKNSNQNDVSMQVDSNLQLPGNAKRNRALRNRAWRQKNERQLRKLISKQLMLSEWLVDVPSDFYTSWFMVPCPRGKRCLVVAAKGRTTVYSRTGYFMFDFQSALPGGAQSQSNRKGSSLLDAVYVEAEHTFYLLDLISLNGYPYLDCEAEFRFFWLQSRFAEDFSLSSPTKSSQQNAPSTSNAIALSDNCDTEMKDGSETPNLSPSKLAKTKKFNGSPKTNEASNISKLFNFVPLQYYDCTVENIASKAKGPYQFGGSIDGVLFYHKHAPYSPGITPLVCWLKVDMIADILQIPI